MKKFTFIDLFAGIGGFHHALQSIGGTCVMACEIDDDCRKVYSNSFSKFPENKFYRNIRDITRLKNNLINESQIREQIKSKIPNHDVLCAGFPCQPFSKSGAQRGTLDKIRGTLFFDIMQIASVKKPKFIILENVRNIAGPRHKETWKLIIESIRKTGYTVCDIPMILSPHMIPPELGGTPQVRERVFITCELTGGKGGIKKNNIITNKTYQYWSPQNWKINQFLDSKIYANKYRINNKEDMWLAAWEYFIKKIPCESLPSFPIWVEAFQEVPCMQSKLPKWEKEIRIKNSLFYCTHKTFIDNWLGKKWGNFQMTVKEFPASRQKFEWQARKVHPTTKNRTIKNLFIQLRPSGIRVKPATYLPALVAITQTSILGPKIYKGKYYRYLTAREAARIQGFPENIFKLSKMNDNAAYKQLGNAVNVGIAKLVVKKLLSI